MGSEREQDVVKKHEYDTIYDPPYGVAGVPQSYKEVVTFTKHDSGKLHWSKFAWGGAAWVMRIMEFGAAKYGWDNWRRKDDSKPQRLLNAAARHIVDHFRGKTIDEESGEPTIAHAACCLLFYLEDVKFPEEEKDAIYEIHEPVRHQQQRESDV